jgi:hypothetical protein
MNVYNTNKACYNNLVDKLNTAQTNDDFRVYEYVFNSLFTKKFDYELYKDNGYEMNNLSELLKQRDYVLYNIYLSINSEINIETRKDNIRSIIADIVGTLEYYLTDDGLNYLFSFVSSYTFQDLIRYIYLMICFFKSYKVYFLDPQVTYVTGNKLDYSGRPKDTIKNITNRTDHYDKSNIADNLLITEIMGCEENALSGLLKEVVDIYSIFSPDPSDDYDYDGMYADTELEYKEADGGYADPKTCIPYIMLNAGPAQGGRIDLWDLNGANAEDKINTLDVNGGYPLDLSYLRKDFYRSKFNYIIDAGSASTNSFMTRSARTRVIDRAISTDIKISNADFNVIETKEDGIYLKDIWVDWTEFKEVTNEQWEFINTTTNQYEYLNGVIDLIDTPEDLDAWIRRNRDILLDPMYKLLQYDPDYGRITQLMHDYTDNSIEDLWNEFYAMDPMQSWGIIGQF